MSQKRGRPSRKGPLFSQRILQRPEIIGKSVWFFPNADQKLECIVNDNGTISVKSSIDRQFECANDLVAAILDGTLKVENFQLPAGHESTYFYFWKDLFLSPNHRLSVGTYLNSKRIAVPDVNAISSVDEGDSDSATPAKVDGGRQTVKAEDQCPGFEVDDELLQIYLNGTSSRIVECSSAEIRAVSCTGRKKVSSIRCDKCNYARGHVTCELKRKRVISSTVGDISPGFRSRISRGRPTFWKKIRSRPELFGTTVWFCPDKNQSLECVINSNCTISPACAASRQFASGEDLAKAIMAGSIVADGFQLPADTSPNNFSLNANLFRFPNRKESLSKHITTGMDITLSEDLTNVDQRCPGFELEEKLLQVFKEFKAFTIKVGPNGEVHSNACTRSKNTSSLRCGACSRAQAVVKEQLKRKGYVVSDDEISIPHPIVAVERIVVDGGVAVKTRRRTYAEPEGTNAAVNGKKSGDSAVVLPAKKRLLFQRPNVLEADSFCQKLESRPDMIGRTVWFCPEFGSRLKCVVNENGTISPVCSITQQFRSAMNLIDAVRTGKVVDSDFEFSKKRNSSCHHTFSKDLYFYPNQRHLIWELLTTGIELPAPPDESLFNNHICGGFRMDAEVVRNYQGLHPLTIWEGPAGEIRSINCRRVKENEQVERCHACTGAQQKMTVILAKDNNGASAVDGNDAQSAPIRSTNEADIQPAIPVMMTVLGDPICPGFNLDAKTVDTYLASSNSPSIKVCSTGEVRSIACSGYKSATSIRCSACHKIQVAMSTQVDKKRVEEEYIAKRFAPNVSNVQKKSASKPTVKYSTSATAALKKALDRSNENGKRLLGKLDQERQRSKRLATEISRLKSELAQYRPEKSTIRRAVVAFKNSLESRYEWVESPTCKWTKGNVVCKSSKKKFSLEELRHHVVNYHILPLVESVASLPQNEQRMICGWSNCTSEKVMTYASFRAHVLDEHVGREKRLQDLKRTTHKLIQKYNKFNVKKQQG